MEKVVEQLIATGILLTATGCFSIIRNTILESKNRKEAREKLAHLRTKAPLTQKVFYKRVEQAL